MILAIANVCSYVALNPTLILLRAVETMQNSPAISGAMGMI